MVHDSFLRGGVHDGDCVTARVALLAEHWGGRDVSVSGQVAFVDDEYRVVGVADGYLQHLRLSQDAA